MRMYINAVGNVLSVPAGIATSVHYSDAGELVLDLYYGEITRKWGLVSPITQEQAQVALNEHARRIALGETIFRFTAP